MAKCKVETNVKTVEVVTTKEVDTKEYHLILSEDEVMYLKAILGRVNGVPDGHDEIYSMYSALYDTAGIPWYNLPKTARLFR